MPIHSFQQQIATGRFNLPVAILVSILLWILNGTLWPEIENFLLMTFIGYLMIELNTTYSLIRTRTTIPTSFFGCLMSAFYFLHPYQAASIAIPLCIISLFELFRSYETSEPQSLTYNTFLFFSIGTWFFPSLCYLLPLWMLALITFRSLTMKSFTSSLLGFFTPYWFLLAYSLVVEEPSYWLTPFKEVCQWTPISYQSWNLPIIICMAFATLQLIIGVIHYVMVAYQDKNKTRILLSFLSFLGLYVTVLIVIQPQHAFTWMPLQLVVTSFLTGHLFTLTTNRFTGIYFIIIFVGYNLLTLYLLWMQLFNF